MKSTGTNNIERKGKELKKEDIKKLAKDPADIMSDFEGELLLELLLRGVVGRAKGHPGLPDEEHHDAGVDGDQ